MYFKYLLFDWLQGILVLLRFDINLWKSLLFMNNSRVYFLTMREAKNNYNMLSWSILKPRRLLEQQPHSYNMVTLIISQIQLIYKDVSHGTKMVESGRAQSE
jgi:hypothetical protein